MNPSPTVSELPNHLGPSLDPSITFTEDLPITLRIPELALCLSQARVVVVCGETGSGKTTQLPKLCMALGWGKGRSYRDPQGKRGKMIAHTQPRRLAATSTAKRIAFEVGTNLGDQVGYQIRFGQKVGEHTRLVVMTDGILLAEIARDPWLNRYDTVIVDEAHERSLNIDFLLGHLKRILTRRVDLKVIITSATMDAQLLSDYWSDVLGQPAPIIHIEGRLYPVDIQYIPWQNPDFYQEIDAGAVTPKKQALDSPKDLNQVIVDVAAQLWHDGVCGQGDILVFLPGEQHIRQAHEALRKDGRFNRADILPLYARLSIQEQDKVFHPSNRPRIVLTTNVAETSLTVPGIRYVIDSGLARVNRYSYRRKVEQLQIERIAKANANQRAGRCGRVANGVCVRLYSELDYQQMADYPDAEIFRVSLASVLLQLKYQKIHNVDEFAFLQKPTGRSIADGLQTLTELGAIDTNGRLTSIGRELVAWPIDPQLARMLIAGHEQTALRELLIIVSFLAVQDCRIYPTDAEQAARERHRQWVVEQSEFMAILQMWQWVEQAWQQRTSNQQFQKLCLANFMAPLRIREWREMHGQLLRLAEQRQWRMNDKQATREQIHLALLAGLVTSVGQRQTDGSYKAPRQVKFYPWPGSVLAKNPGAWILVQSLVETKQLYGRMLARIEPRWVEQVAQHLLTHHYGEPYWDAKQCRVVIHEEGQLYGLTLYKNRKVDYVRLDPQRARRMMLHATWVASAEVEQEDSLEWQHWLNIPIVQYNQSIKRQMEVKEHQLRRHGLLVDDEDLVTWLDQRIPAEIIRFSDMRRWLQAIRVPTLEQHPLCWQPADLLRAGSDSQSDDFPAIWSHYGVTVPLRYEHNPGHQTDGVSVVIPLLALSVIEAEAGEWLVPGMLEEKVFQLLKTLPNKVRHRCQPLAQTAKDFIQSQEFGKGNLLQQLARFVQQKTHLVVNSADFRPEQLSPHLLMNYVLENDEGQILAMDRSLSALKLQWSKQANHQFQSLLQLKKNWHHDREEVRAGATLDITQDDASKETQISSIKADQFAATNQSSKRSSEIQSVAVNGAKDTNEQHSGDGVLGNSLLDIVVKDGVWRFGTLPQQVWMQQGELKIAGYPALYVRPDQSVGYTLSDRLAQAQAMHDKALLKMIAQSNASTIKALNKELSKQYGSQWLISSVLSFDALFEQLLNQVIRRAFLGHAAEWPRSEADYQACLQKGKPALALLMRQMATQLAQVLVAYESVKKKMQGIKLHPQIARDMQQQLTQLVHPQFLADAAAYELVDIHRYLQGMMSRLQKLNANEGKDLVILSQIQDIERRWHQVTKAFGDSKDWPDSLRTVPVLLQELRISLYAQELKTKQTVSIKRIQKIFDSIGR